jgi:hypothetical protein
MRLLGFLIAAAVPLFASPAAAHGPRSEAFPVPRQTPYPDRGSPARLAEYRAAQAELEAARGNLGARWRAAPAEDRAAVEAEAKDALDRGLVALTAPWLGTPWDFYGTSEAPGQGKVACGYFVSTLLRDAGVRVERVRLAQQASEYIVKSVAPEGRTARFRQGRVDAVLHWVRAQPERWFVVGLDYHVGLLLRLDDGEVRLCHASVLSPSAAVCEDAQEALAMASGYHVVGALFTPRLVQRWLAGDAVPTVLPVGRVR